jgi:hypothetical protein
MALPTPRWPPTAHRSGPVKGSLEQAPPRSRVHVSLERASPRSRVHASLEQAPPHSRGHASLERVPPRSRAHLRLTRGPLTSTPTPARGYEHLMMTQQSRAIMRLGITPRRCSANSLEGNPSPPLWGTVQHGQCQLRDTAPPTPVRLTRRALERGAATPSNRFLVNLQGQAMTLGRQDAIPVTVDPVRPPPCLRHHTGHCYNNSIAAGRMGMERRHACYCIPYRSPSTASSSPSEDATANHYALTFEAATVQVQDMP